MPYAHDPILIANSQEELDNMVGYFNYFCKRRMLKVNVNLGKTLIFETDGRSQHKISLHGEEVELVDEFKHLRVKVSKDGSGKA